jgi:hypothetical protein
MATACFLELTDLLEYCHEEILASLSRHTILQYTIDLDKIRPPTDASRTRKDREYYHLLKVYHAAVQSAVLSYLCQLVNVGLSTASSMSNENSGKRHLDPLFEELPVRWLKRVIECDALCIADEYERYELLKCIAIERRKTFRKRKASLDGTQVRYLSNLGNSANSPSVQNDGSKSGVSRLFGSYMPFGGMVGAKKAKTSDDSGSDTSMTSRELYERTSTPNTPMSPSMESRAAGPGLVNLYGVHDSARSEAEEQEDAVIMSIFQNSIIYTYMTFAQLERVKSDRIVPESSVMQSFWMQAELTSRFSSPNPSGKQPALPSLKPFRFAARFRNVRSFFRLDGPEAGSNSSRRMMVSDPVKCAGVDYRVLLGLSDDEAALPAFNSSSDALGNITSSTSSSTTAISSSSSSQHTVNAGNIPVESSKKKLVLKAHLQRNRTQGPQGSNSSSNSMASTVVSYSIYMFDISAFAAGGDRWKQFHKPLTACDFDGNGFVKGFPLPPPSPPKSGEGEGDIWLIVNICLVRE